MKGAWLCVTEFAALRPGIQVRAPRRIYWNEGEVPHLGKATDGSLLPDELRDVGDFRLGLRSSPKMWALHRRWIAWIAKACILRVPSSLGRALSPNLCQAPQLKTCGEITKWKIVDKHWRELKITGVANKMPSPGITSWGSSTASTNCAQLPHLPRTPSIVRDVGEGGAKRSLVRRILAQLATAHATRQVRRLAAWRAAVACSCNSPNDALHLPPWRKMMLGWNKWGKTECVNHDQPWYTDIHTWFYIMIYHHNIKKSTVEFVTCCDICCLVQGNGFS